MKKLILLLSGFIISLSLLGQVTPKEDVQKYLNSYYQNITSDKLLEYVKELSGPKYEGRLAGSKGMELASNWVIDLFDSWEIEPAGDNGGYIQFFTQPCTEVTDGSLEILFPVINNDKKIKEKVYITKSYPWAEGWYSGGATCNGEVTADVVYAGYGVSAPELGYDDYADIDVRGKIVLIDGETPNTSRNADTLRMWYNHTLHQTKIENAVKNGAVGLLYNWVCGPNSLYSPGFITAHVNTPVINDLFLGTGKTYKETVAKIKENKKPQSFDMGKKATIKMSSTHNPNAKGRNILGVIKGSDPALADEYVIISGHLDHLGMVPHLIPGANDNNAATAVIMGVAEALAKAEIRPRRSIIFFHTDAEEAGLGGSQFYVKNPIVPKEKVVAILNLEQPGIGTGIRGSYGVEYPGLIEYMKKMNDSYVHRNLRSYPNSHITRPRTDGAVFMKAGYPCVDIGATGGNFKGYYHNPKDDWDTITPEIMQDIVKCVMLTAVELANDTNIKLK